MVTAGELVNEGGRYSLTGRLLDRQLVQDSGRVGIDDTWDGTWWTALVTAERRPMAARRAFRSELTNLRFGELRPDTWLRPANLGDEVEAELAQRRDVVVQRGPLLGSGRDGIERRLWPLDDLASHAGQLLEAMDATKSVVAGSDPADLPEAFLVSAAVVRHLRSEPRLPTALVPDPWPPALVRSAYDAYEAGFQRLLRSFLLSR
jgi:phenylacetic acid degradation operon negative regulatory protein